MLLKSKRAWELSEGEATPERLFRSRREILTGAAVGAILAASPHILSAAAAAGPRAALYPAPQNGRYTVDRPLTGEKFATTYNNFYEFGSQKDIARPAQALKLRPWQIAVDGMVEKTKVLDLDDLVKIMPVEERLYRHRCVEAWAMAVPWTGFPMKAFVDWARPLGSAKYVRMETFVDAKIAPGQKQFWYPWPYVEGLTMAEAINELSFLVIGAYGKPAARQNGAPLRLALPWKYGFKSIKSIVRVSFGDERPVSFWEKLQPAEYGFWANVNPDVPHPRWSQKTERMLGTDERRPTLKWNGYGEFVADLYRGLEKERLFT